MSSNIRVTKVCGFCNQEFIAKTILTRYCSHSCNNKAYKEAKRKEKIESVANPRNPTIPTILKLNNADPDYSVLGKKEFLTIAETCQLLNISSVTLRRWIKDSIIKTSRIGKKHIIKRIEINAMLLGDSIK